MRTAELEVKLYTDEDLDNQFASIYEKGAVLLADAYTERPDAKSYALHVYLADENGVVDGYVSLKRIIKKPLEADLESGAAYADDLPVAQTKVIWKKNAARGEAPAETESGEPNASTEDENISALPLDEDEVSALPLDEDEISALPLDEDEISALPLDEDETADRPVADEDGETTEALVPTPVVVWPEPGEATPGEISREGDEDEIALPILEDEERPVADGEGTEGATTPAEIIEWPEEAAQTPEISVYVMIDWPEGESIPEGAPVWMTAVVTGVDADAVHYQWQYAIDNENWIDIDGANNREYEAVMTANNAGGYWRVSVSVPDQEQGDEEA